MTAVMWILGGLIGWGIVSAYVVGMLRKASRRYPQDSRPMAPVIPIREDLSDAS